MPKSVRVTLRIVATLGLLAAAFGGMVLATNPHAIPKCDGKPMHPGQTCVTVRAGQTSATSDDRWSYARSKQSMEESLTIDTYLLVVGGIAFLAAFITLRVVPSPTKRR